MNKAPRIGLTAVVIVACAGAASAATMTQTLSFGPSSTSFSHDFVFNQFNPALGTLTGVTDTLTENLSASTTVTNTGTSAGEFQWLAISNHAEKNFNGLPLLNATSVETLSGNIAAGATEMFSGTTSSSSTASGLFGGKFIGTDTITGSSVDDVNMGGFSPGCVFTTCTSSSSSVTGEITDELVYTYTPAAVPEPSSLALLGSTLFGFGIFRRRRRGGRSRGSAGPL
jgi:hypothetical protein